MLKTRFLSFLLIFTHFSQFCQPKTNISMSYYSLSGKIKINERTFQLKKEEFAIDSPVVLGSVGGGITLIILVIIIFCVCKKKNPQLAEAPVKVEMLEKIDASIDLSNAKLNKDQMTFNDENNVINEAIEREKQKNENEGDNSKEKLEDSAQRNLMGTHLELKEEKIKNLFQNFQNQLLAAKYGTENDKYELYKAFNSNALNNTPNTNIQNSIIEISTDMASSVSKFKGIKIDPICFTISNRDSPTNSFYDKKMEEIEQIKDLVEEDKATEIKKEIKKEENINKAVTFNPNSKPEEQNHKDSEEEEEEEGEEEEFPEDVVHKNQLQPDADDIISDFHEKTKNVKIEIHKKSTIDFDKESEIRRKKKGPEEIFVYLESKVKTKK